MNILIMGGNYLGAALRKRGHNVVSINFDANSDILLAHPVTWTHVLDKLGAVDFQPDILLYLDNGNLPFLIDPHRVAVPSIFYSIDTYCNPWHVPYAQAFDMAYVAQKDFLPLFSGQKAIWLPLFWREGIQVSGECQRDLPVSFVGTIGHKNNPSREPFLLKVKEKAPLTIISGDFVSIFQRSRIVLNQTAFGEINFRCFEAMALGAALLMEKCENGMDELFEPGVNILPVFSRNNADEAAAIARVFLSRPTVLAEIARRGRELVLNRHTDFSRAAQVAADARNLLAEKEGLPRLKEPMSRKSFTQTAFAMLAEELKTGDLAGYSEFFNSLAQ